VTSGGVIRPGPAIDAVSSALIVTPLMSATWRARMARVSRALLVTSAMLVATPALAQADAGSEGAPAEPVEGGPAAPPATTAPTLQPDEAAPSTPPISAPTSPPVLEKPGPTEAVSAPKPDKPPGAPSAAPIASPVPASPPRQGPPAGKRDGLRPAATLTIVNGRAVPATGVAVLVGAKVVKRSGPLTPNTRVTLRLPSSIGCRVSVVASFSWGYSALRYGKVNVCKVGHALVRL
jgi:hypothetical protein